MRPAALMRGASWKATWVAEGRFAVRDARDLEKRPQTRVADPVEAVQAEFDDHPVLSGQGHDIGDGGHGHQFQEGEQHSLHARPDPSEALNSAWISLSVTAAPQRFFSG